MRDACCSPQLHQREADPPVSEPKLGMSACYRHLTHLQIAALL